MKHVVLTIYLVALRVALYEVRECTVSYNTSRQQLDYEMLFIAIDVNVMKVKLARLAVKAVYAVRSNQQLAKVQYHNKYCIQGHKYNH